MTNFLEVHHVRKSYGPALAVSDVDLAVARGTIVGLCGENGAGKSTLVKILSGAVSPDSGEILINGQSYEALTPDLSASLGIGTVFQEFELIPGLKVFENVFLGIEHRRGWLKDPAPMRAATKELLERVGAPIRVDDEVGLLRTGHQQIVEIAKALARGSSLLILDEPTAALNSVERNLLFTVLRKLKSQGIAIIFISHFIGELFEICDRLVILRDGRIVRDNTITEMDEEAVIFSMIGARVDRERRSVAAPAAPGETAMELEAASEPGAYANVDVSVRSGEIVGLAGPIGSGCYEVAETFFGLRNPKVGRLRMRGRELSLGGPADAVAHRIGYVPEDRKLKGLCLNLGAAINVALPSLASAPYSRAGVIRNATIARRFRAVGERLKLRPLQPRFRANAFSGGGQQKILIGRWLDRECEFYVLVEPTRGVDVGAKAEIWGAIAELAANGAGVLIVSTEAEDIVALASRCYVMVRGRIVGELVHQDVTTDNIARLSFTPTTEQAVANA